MQKLTKMERENYYNIKAIQVRILRVNYYQHGQVLSIIKVNFFFVICLEILTNL